MLVSPMGTLFNSEITADNVRVTSDLDYAHMPHYPQPAVGVPFQNVVDLRRASKRLPRGPVLKLLRVPSGDACLNGGGVSSSLKPRDGSSAGFSEMMPPLSKNPPGKNPIVCVILCLRCRAARPDSSNAKVQGFLKSCHSRFGSRMQPAFRGDSVRKFCVVNLLLTLATGMRSCRKTGYLPVTSSRDFSINRKSTQLLKKASLTMMAQTCSFQASIQIQSILPNSFPIPILQ
jgi:hypothetical protein